MELNNELDDIAEVLFATHGKRVKGWLLPDAPGCQTVGDNVLNHVGRMVEDIFGSVKESPRKKSDSRSISSSLAGEMGVQEQRTRRFLI